MGGFCSSIGWGELNMVVLEDAALGFVLGILCTVCATLLFWMRNDSIKWKIKDEIKKFPEYKEKEEKEMAKHIDIQSKLLAKAVMELENMKKQEGDKHE